MYTHSTTVYGNDEVTPTLINWRAIFGGAVIGIGMLVLLSTLWLALAFPSNVTWVNDNLKWFLGGTAIFALFVAGYAAGVSSGARGLGAGMAQAFTLWSLVLIASIAIAIPVMRVLNITFAATDLSVGATGATGTVLNGGPVSGPLWTIFWSMLIALGAAVVGGMLGGATPRRAVTPVTGVAPAVAAAPTRPERVESVGEEPTRTDQARRPRRVS
jgi:hypothetical protein